MRIGCMAALIIVNFVLQSTVLPHVAILGVQPDTAIVLIVSYGLLRGDVEGALFGFFTGLAQDLFASHFIGLYALLGFLVGFAAGKPFKDYFKDNFFLPFMMVVVATLAHQFLFYVFAFLFRGRVDFWFYLRAIIVPVTIYTASIAIPLYSLLFVINAKIENFERYRRNMFDKD